MHVDGDRWSRDLRGKKSLEEEHAMQCGGVVDSRAVDLNKPEQMTQVLYVSPHQPELIIRNTFTALHKKWFSIGSPRLLDHPGELNKQPNSFLMATLFQL